MCRYFNIYNDLSLISNDPDKISNQKLSVREVFCFYHEYSVSSAKRWLLVFTKMCVLRHRKVCVLISYRARARARARIFIIIHVYI